MLILLIGPKGSGKSHIGRLLESELNIRFFHVEPLWIKYYVECREAGREPSVSEGISQIHPAVSAALRLHGNVCVETTGASKEIIDDLLLRTGESNTLLIKISAPITLCLERIRSRDQKYQIPMAESDIRKMYALSQSLDLQFDLRFENITLAPEEIVRSVRDVLQSGDKA